MLSKPAPSTLHYLGAKQRALELGIEELAGLCEWEFRSRPRTIRRLRAAYVAFAMRLYRALERAKRSKGIASASHERLGRRQ